MDKYGKSTKPKVGSQKINKTGKSLATGIKEKEKLHMLTPGRQERHHQTY